VRQIRMLRAMWRELETGLRRLPHGHGRGNPETATDSPTDYRASSRPYQPRVWFDQRLFAHLCARSVTVVPFPEMTISASAAGLTDDAFSGDGATRQIL
jgi:hypothetical protein